MKKLFILSIIPMIMSAAANAATTIPWWQQPTVCRLNPANCYTGMGAGYDSGMWDAGANCWGLKLICTDALVSSFSDPQPMGKNEIAKGSGIKPDFDTNVLNGDCFGLRRTSSNGAMASVNGKFVNVWCGGILDNPDETVANGEITYGAQPTCAALAENGYVGVLNGRCYGKYYNASEYYIECTGTDPLPSRLIVLNGADYENTAPGAPADSAAANAKFDTMQRVSERYRKDYYNGKI